MNRFFFLFVGLITAIALHAQSSLDYVWKDKGVYESVPDTFKNADAVMIYQHKETNLIIENNSLYITTGERTYQKIKFLTQKGIQQFARIYFPVIYEDDIKELDARTIKSDGTVIDLKSSDIKKLNIPFQLDASRKFKLMIFSIPGVEVNDEVEIITRYSGRGLMTSNEVSLYTPLPTLKSSYTMNISRDIRTEIKTYNQMQQPEIVRKSDIVTYTWTQKDLHAANGGLNSIPSKTLPYLRFAVRDLTVRYGGQKQTEPVEPNNWSSFIDLVLYISEPPNYWGRPKIQYLNTFLDEQLNKTAQKTKLEKLVKVHNYINDSIEVERLKEEESNNPLGYHLYNRKIDGRNLIFLYSKIFQELGLNYFLGIGKSKFAGDIDLNFVSRSQITHYFFAVEVEDKLYLLFLKDEDSFYSLGETPVELQGTDVIMVSRKDIPDRIKKITLPVSDKNVNYYRNRTIVNMDSLSNTLIFNTKETFSGTPSTVYRQEMIKENSKLVEKRKGYYVNKKSSLTLDTIGIVDIQHSYPYVFTVNSKMHTTEPLNIVGKDMLTVSMNDLINHHCIISEPYKRDLDYYSDYTYSDNIKYYFVFDNPVEIVNKEAFEMKVQNDYGTYNFTINPINEKTILVDSDYEINKEMLEKEKYSLITELYDAVQKVNNSQLLFRIIK